MKKERQAWFSIDPDSGYVADSDSADEAKSNYRGGHAFEATHDEAADLWSVEQLTKPRPKCTTHRGW